MASDGQEIGFFVDAGAVKQSRVAFNRSGVERLTENLGFMAMQCTSRLSRSPKGPGRRLTPTSKNQGVTPTTHCPSRGWKMNKSRKCFTLRRMRESWARPSPVWTWKQRCTPGMAEESACPLRRHNRTYPYPHYRHNRFV
jgi:hypothetical protein